MRRGISGGERKHVTTGIIGRISLKTWACMEIFLSSFATNDYEAMASALIEMGAIEENVDSKAFAKDLQKVFSSIQYTMERGVVHACHARDVMHSLKGWSHHEVRAIEVDRIDEVWDATMKHGLKPV